MASHHTDYRLHSTAMSGVADPSPWESGSQTPLSWPYLRLRELDMVEAALCDIDGTLVESNWLHAAAWKDAFEVVDIAVGLGEARKQIGKGGDKVIPRLRAMVEARGP